MLEEKFSMLNYVKCLPSLNRNTWVVIKFGVIVIKSLNLGNCVDFEKTSRVKFIVG